MHESIRKKYVKEEGGRADRKRLGGEDCEKKVVGVDTNEAQ